MKNRNYILSIVAAALMTACSSSEKETVMMKQSDFPAPPVAEVIPDTFSNF